MLRQAFDAFDEPTVQAVLDRLLSDLSVTVVMREIVLPYLAELGERWERGDASIAQEHFASNLIRGRLAGLARGWGDGSGPRASLACPSGEQHDLALMIFGVSLNRYGWRIDYLGVDTPIEELTQRRRPGSRTSSSWPPPSRASSSRSPPNSPRSPTPHRWPWPGQGRLRSLPPPSGPGC
jgi:methanogenic corrinoid protein MtbC1